MPHSSGGGSSSGGSHSSGGGSFHSSEGGSDYSGSGIRFSRRYIPGDRVFVRYGSHGPRYYYSDSSLIQIEHAAHAIIWGICLFLIILLGVYIPMFILDMIPPRKVTKGQEPCIIEDEAGCFSSDEADLIEEACSRYYALTGIPIEIHTITQEDYLAADKRSLETYAYYDYVNRFEDEDHWLIVFEDIDPAARKWAFEGMQGDNTDEWLTSSVTSDFNRSLTSNLWKETNSYGEAFAASIIAAASEGHKPDGVSLFMCIMLMTVMGPPLVIIVIQSKRLNKYHEVAIPAQDRGTGPQLVTCDYCGGTYIRGENSCPHCGAPDRKN